MARESIDDRINRAAASIDGAASFLEEMVQSSDRETSRQAFALADLLVRISADLSKVAVEVQA